MFGRERCVDVIKAWLGKASVAMNEDALGLVRTEQHTAILAPFVVLVDGASHQHQMVVRVEAHGLGCVRS